MTTDEMNALLANEQWDCFCDGSRNTYIGTVEKCAKCGRSRPDPETAIGVIVARAQEREAKP